MQAHFCRPEGPASASLQGTEATGSSQVHTSCPALSRCASGAGSSLSKAAPSLPAGQGCGKVSSGPRAAARLPDQSQPACSTPPFSFLFLVVPEGIGRHHSWLFFSFSFFFKSVFLLGKFNLPQCGGKGWGAFGPSSVGCGFRYHLYYMRTVTPVTHSGLF